MLILSCPPNVCTSEGILFDRCAAAVRGFLNKLKRMTELSSLHLPVNSLYYTIFIVVCIVEKNDRFLLTKIKEVIT